MMDFIAALLLLLGSFFIFIGSVGLVRFADFYFRIQILSKSYAAGVSILLIASALAIGDWIFTVKALLSLLALTITVPIGAHLLLRAALQRRLEARVIPQPNEYKVEGDE